MPALALSFGLEFHLVVPEVALPVSGLPTDRTWRFRDVVLGVAVVFALSARLAFLEGIESLDTIR